MPFAFTPALSPEQWSIGVPIKKAQAIAAVDNQKQALVGVPRLRTRIAMGAIGTLANHAVSHRTFRRGHTNQGRTEGRIDDWREIARQIHGGRREELGVCERFR
jgi:hypothetical protein